MVIVEVAFWVIVNEVVMFEFGYVQLLISEVFFIEVIVECRQLSFNQDISAPESLLHADEAANGGMWLHTHREVEVIFEEALQWGIDHCSCGGVHRSCKELQTGQTLPQIQAAGDRHPLNAEHEVGHG